jgi:dTDP-4-amino-4,6-dideoxygalactose transaminase
MRNIIRRKSQTYPGYLNDFWKTFSSSSWFQGDYIHHFNQEYAKKIGVKHAISTSYGLHAMSLALAFYNFNQENEILIPGYTAMVVKRCLDEMNISYRCVDIELNRGTMCPLDFAKKITPKTKGVIVTHLLGNSCSEEIIKIARDRNLLIIEDCAHVHGAFTNERPLGSLGDAAFFSFSYSKIINTYTGGMLLTNNDELRNFALKNLAATPSPTRKQLLRKLLLGHAENFVAIPFVTFICAPIIRSNHLLKKIKNGLNYLTRKKVLTFFQYSNTQALQGLKQLSQLETTLKRKSDKAQFIEENTSIKYLERKDGDVYYNHIAIVPDALKYRTELLKYGIDTGCGNSIMEIMRPEDNLPGCLAAHNSYLMIPNYDSLTKTDLERIVKAINATDALLCGNSSSSQQA